MSGLVEANNQAVAVTATMHTNCSCPACLGPQGAAAKYGPPTTYWCTLCGRQKAGFEACSCQDKVGQPSLPPQLSNITFSKSKSAAYFEALRAFLAKAREEGVSMNDVLGDTVRELTGTRFVP